MESNPQVSSPHRRRRIAVIVAGGVAALVLTGWAASWPAERWGELANLAEQVAGQARSLGAGWFFAAFAVLPAIGCPVSVFALAAGPLFGPTLGLPTVLALTGASMATSMTISYGLARYVLRPWVTRLLGYLGYTAPAVPEAKWRMFVFLVRVTPGPPYVFQSFLLGLAEVGFGTYFAISWVIATANVSLVVVFGDALMKGNAKVALAALAGVVLVVAAVKLLRKRVAGRAPAAEAAGRGGADA